MRRSALLLAGAALFAQVQAPGPQEGTFLSEIDNSDQPYALYVPRKLEPGRKYPLVVSLHGEAANHRLALRQVFGFGIRPGDPEASLPRIRDVDFIVASPLARGSNDYRGIAEHDVYEMIDQVKRRLPVDEDRVYLTGVSAGGAGALRLALTRPDVWAAVAAVAPFGTEGLAELAGNALGLPVRLYQGEADPLVAPAATRALYQALFDAGAQAEYIEYPGVRHNAWDRAFSEGAIFGWFGPLRRAARPSRIRYATREYEHRAAWWLSIDALNPGEPAKVDASIEPGNVVTVRTSGVDGFTLALLRAPARVSVDGAAVKLLCGTPKGPRCAPQIGFSRRAGRWTAKPYTYAKREKRPGAAGPARAVIASRHLYVYGTGAASGEAELRSRREQAEQAAEWSTPRARVRVNFRVLPDAAVSDTDLLTSNLVLFGTRETNSIIERLGSELPVELNPGAADFGLVLVVPNGERQALVSSGLPWWTRADQVRRAGLPPVAAPFQLLETIPDYILFKGGLDGVIAEGRLDREWRLPREAAARMQATGAVTLH